MTRRARPFVRRRAAGHTFAEVMVAAALVGIFATVAAGASRLLNVSTSALRDRACAATELRLATEHLRQDFAAAVDAVPGETPGLLRITRDEAVARVEETWLDGADEGIEYELRDAKLVRRDVASGAEVIVATHVGTFDVTEPSAEETSIRVVVTTPELDREVTLVWSRP